MLGEFHNGAHHCSARTAVLRKCANAAARILALTPPLADAASAAAMRPPAVERGVSASIARKWVDYRCSSRRLLPPGAARPPPGAAPAVVGDCGRDPSAAGARDRGASGPGDGPRSTAEGRWDGTAGAGR